MRRHIKGWLIIFGAVLRLWPYPNPNPSMLSMLKSYFSLIRFVWNRMRVKSMENGASVWRRHSKRDFRKTKKPLRRTFK